MTVKLKITAAQSIINGDVTMFIKRLTFDADGLITKSEILNDRGQWEDSFSVRENFMYPSRCVFLVKVGLVNGEEIKEDDDLS